MSSPPTPDLTGVHAKLDRAEEHIDTLRDEIKTFVEGTSYARFEARLNPIDESYSVIFHESEPLPAHRWGLIVGDACYNMRCALNYFVCALVPQGQIHRRHQFPIFDSAHAWQSEFGGRRAEKMLDFVDPAHVALIESVQPYQPTGLARLAMLERFTNTDKHRLIHAATTNLIDAPAINFSRVIPVAVSDVTYPPTGQAVTDGTEIARFKGDMGLNLAPQPDGRFAVLNSSVQVEAGFQAGTLFGEPGKEDTRAREFGPSSRKPAPTRIRARKRAPRHVARRRCLRFALAVLKRVPPSRASARRSPGAHKEDQPLSITPDEPSPEARLSSNLQIAIGHIQAAVWAMKRITTNDDPAHGITDADWGFLPGFCTEIL